MHRCWVNWPKGARQWRNLMVGAIIGINDEIIGEGYHVHYGQAHAEVNCINSVPAAKTTGKTGSRNLLITEPCAH